MAKRTIHCEELGACEICANCVEQRHPWYYCGCGNEDFGDIDYPNECDDFEHLDDDEDEDEYDDFRVTFIILYRKIVKEVGRCHIFQNMMLKISS